MKKNNPPCNKMICLRVSEADHKLLLEAAWTRKKRCSTWIKDEVIESAILILSGTKEGRVLLKHWENGEKA